METVWSNTDFPYMCLKDEVRTKVFRKAIHQVVKKGDVVADVGAGSGILSFFAAEAGAKKVYAVEIEHLLVEKLRESIKLNNLEKTIEVIEGNAMKVKLPKNVDVLITEMIETGLLDELQVPGFNSLRANGAIDSKTRIIPSHYKTFLQLVYSDNTYYGYKILAPKHEWPFYSNKSTNWHQTAIESVSKSVEIVSANFTLGIIEENIDVTVALNLNKKKKANGIRISGLITLAPNIELGATNVLNGDKILPIDIIERTDLVKLRIRYRMGGGLGNLRVKRIL